MFDYSKIPFKVCPYCNSDEGFYFKEQVRGSVNWKYNFDGSEADNSDLYDYLRYYGGKVAYCLNCNKKLFDSKLIERKYLK